MAANDWRISVFNSAGKWQGYTFAAKEAEARAQVPQVQWAGCQAVVSSWDPEARDYREQFVISDDGEACRVCDGSGTDAEGVDCRQCQGHERCPKCGLPIEFVEPTPTDETFRQCSAGCGWSMS